MDSSERVGAPISEAVPIVERLQLPGGQLVELAELAELAGRAFVEFATTTTTTPDNVGVTGASCNF